MQYEGLVDKREGMIGVGNIWLYTSKFCVNFWISAFVNAVTGFNLQKATEFPIDWSDAFESGSSEALKNSAVWCRYLMKVIANPMLVFGGTGSGQFNSKLSAWLKKSVWMRRRRKLISQLVKNLKFTFQIYLNHSIQISVFHFISILIFFFIVRVNLFMNPFYLIEK